jgi:ribonuclease BN (tRNA processing enzyme)
MRLTFAGCGSAFTVGTDNYQSNLLLTVDAVGDDGCTRPCHLLVDCGSDARYSLPRVGIERPSDLDAVYITHTHADHIGGLEWLALNCRYAGQRKRPKLFVPAPLQKQLWDCSLAGGLAISEDGPATLDDYFTVYPVADGEPFVWGGVRFYTVPVVHVGSGSLRMWSYGLHIETASHRLYLTSDAKFDPQLGSRPFAATADLIFHDCETGRRSGVHSHYEDLRTLPLALRQKIWLYHYSPGPLPDAIADGFRGFIHRGQSFEL